MTFFNHDGEENMNVRFVYVPQTIFNRTQEKVSKFINTDKINWKNSSTINKNKIKTKTLKKTLKHCTEKPDSKSNLWKQVLTFNHFVVKITRI